MHTRLPQLPGILTPFLMLGVALLVGVMRCSHICGFEFSAANFCSKSLKTSIAGFCYELDMPTVDWSLLTLPSGRLHPCSQEIMATTQKGMGWITIPSFPHLKSPPELSLTTTSIHGWKWEHSKIDKSEPHIWIRSMNKVPNTTKHI